MTDLRNTIAPKSDQLNADDLIGRTLTITITKVAANPESAEQPISIFFDGDNGKPYRPCKSMRRVLVAVWGPDGNAFVGRSMTLYRDDKVMFGGLAVGGIRISHMSDITKDMTMALTATRANRKPFTVKPLKISKPAAVPSPRADNPPASGQDVGPRYPFATGKGGRMIATGSEWIATWRKLIDNCRAADALDKLAAAREMNKGAISEVGEFDPKAEAEVNAMLDAALPDVGAADEPGFDLPPEPPIADDEVPF